MKAVFITNPLPGRDFRSELRYPLIAAAFIKRVYPEAQCVLASAGEIPEIFSRIFTVIKFPFDRGPYALMRAAFWSAFVSSEKLSDTVFFLGHDVTVLNRFPDFDEYALMTNYRFHPSQPYCCDFIAFNPSKKREGIDFFSETLRTHRWMPLPIQDGAADQLSWATVLGMPEFAAFNGKPFPSPRRPNVLALPVDPFFYTPNDAFPSRATQFTGRNRVDEMATPKVFKGYINEKTSLHFKGPRKGLMLDFTSWAWKMGFLDIDFLDYSEQQLFYKP